jgi:chemotaxis protein CheD
MKTLTSEREEVTIIGIGEFRVSKTPLSSIGLGSCIGLVLHDKERQIGGLSHIMLPASQGRTDRPGKYADTAIEALLNEIGLQRVNSGTIVAKLVGGASMFVQFSESFSIGEKNIEAVRTILKFRSIPIVAEDVGGKMGRTMVYYPVEGGRITIRRGDGSTREI